MRLHHGRRDQTHLRCRGATLRHESEPPMRFSPLVPARRPLFGRRVAPPEPPVVAGPSSEERRLIDRIIRHAGNREKI